MSVNKYLNIMKIKKNRGQTLVEIVIATGIIVVVFVGCLSLAAMTIKIGRITKEKNQALNLAQEGIEAVRNIRDNNWLLIEKGVEGATWDEGNPSSNRDKISPSQNGLTYNKTEEKWEFTREPIGDSPQPDYFDENLNRVENENDAKFKRIIDIENDPESTGEEKKEITVTVSWDDEAKQVETVSQITNWIGINNPPPPEPCTDLPPSPISYWNLDEGSGITASDLEGNNEGYLKYNGDLDGDGTSNGPIWTSSGNARIGNSALRYDGDDYVRIPDDSSLDIGGDITIETWAKFSDLDSKQAIVGKCEGYAGYSVRINQNGVGERYVSFKYEGIGKSWSSVDPAIWEDYRYVVTNNNVTINDTEWFHIVAVKEGTEMKLYINGGNKATLTDVIPYNKEGLSDPEEFNNNYDLFFGGDPQGSLPGSQNYPFNGKNDEIKIYDVALNDDQICNIYNNAPPEPPPSTAVSIASGYYHSLAVLSDGTIKSWGSDSSGQLGNDAAYENQPTPVDVAGINNAIAVAAGSDHSLALLADGTIKSWGSDYVGQLGDDAALVDQPTPVDVVGIDNAIAIAAGDYFSLALLSNGTIKSWGTDAYGELGNDAEFSPDQPTPVDVVGIDNATTIAAGWKHSLAILSGGAIKSWGRDSSGELGDGDPLADQPTPVDVVGINDAVDIAIGGYHALAVLSDGTIMSWGDNGTGGQLGNLDNYSSDGYTTTPIYVDSIGNAVSVSASWTHSLALLSDNTIKSWGTDWSGELGDDDPLVDQPTPVDVLGIDNATAIAKGLAWHSLAILSNGSIKSWGWDNRGQLGDDAILTDKHTPINVFGIP